MKTTRSKYDPLIPGIPIKYLQGIAVFLFVLLLVLFLRLHVRMIPLYWVMLGFLITFSYFYVVHFLERKTLYLTTARFQKRLFWYSFVIRLVAVLVLVGIAEITWDREFYVGAVDATRYYRVASEVAQVFWNDGFYHIYRHLMDEYFYVDNIGVPFVIGMLFAFSTESVLIAKALIALMGSFSVVLIYRTASYLFDQPTARLAGLLAAFLPLSLFYDAVILKESFVVFLSSLTVYLATRMLITGRITAARVFFLSASLASIFLFRTAAGAVLVLCLAVFFLVNHVRGNPMVSWMAGGLVIVLFVIFLNMTGQTDYFIQRIERGTEHGEARIAAVERGTTWQDLAFQPAFLMLAHFGPFPSMIDLKPFWGHDATYYWIGGLVAWNILAYFSLIGLWYMIRHRARETVMVWGFTLGYTLILGITAMFTQVRLGWNVMPMMMIPAAVGLKNFRNINYFYLYLVLAGMLILAWNIFRGVGRGVF